MDRISFGSSFSSISSSISILIGTITVGYYSNYNTIILQVTSFITLIFTALKSSVGNFVTETESDSQYNMFEIIEVYNFWIVSICAIYFFTLMPDLIELLFGKEYLLSTFFLISIILNFYTSNIRQTLWIYRETTGVFSKTKYITLITAIINLILSIVFGIYFGIAGIVMATVISRMIYAWWKEPKIIYKEIFNKSPKKYYVTYIIRLLLMVVICTILWLIFKSFNIENLLISIIVKFAITSILVLIIYIILYRKNKAFSFLKEKFINKVGRHG